ncbi:MAG: FecR family protein [Chlorobi bacterium]|nr:FecR family protein [Chlorobiota bacterium]
MTKLDKERLLKYLEAVRISSEHKYLIELFSELKEHKEFSEFLKSDWENYFSEDEAPQKDLEHILDRIHFMIEQIEEEQKKKTITRIFSFYSKVASILLIPVVAVGIYFYNNTPVTVKTASFTPETEIVAPENSRVKYTLPDSSVVWLNSGAKISYKADFIKNREIRLKGKAYFEVTHLNNTKFTVEFTNGLVEVLGTRFSINDKGNGNFNVILAEGKVRALIGKEQKPVILKPNQILEVNGSHHTVNKINAENSIAWKEGKLIFRNTSLSEVARQLSEYYNVDVKLIGKDLQNLTYRGTFKDEKLEDVLKLLNLTLPVKSKIIQPEKLKNGNFSTKQVIIFSNK